MGKSCIHVITSTKEHKSNVRFHGMGRVSSRPWNGEQVITYLDPQWWRVLTMASRLCRHGSRPYDILYLNSLFNAKFSLLPLVAWALHIIPAEEVLIAPRGELGTAARTSKAWKKQPVLRLVKLLSRKRNVYWQATAEHEVRDICRELSVPQDQIVLHSDDWPPPRPADSSPIITEALRLVFIGRLVPIKGLTGALKTLAQVKHPVHFDVVGSPEDTAYATLCETMAEELPQHVQVVFHGHTDRDKIQNILRLSHALYLPTQGENFGYAIAECLASGVPALIPDTTPWTPLINNGAGAILTGDPGTDAELLDNLALNPAQLAALGEKAEKIYAEAYNHHTRSTDSLFRVVQSRHGCRV